MRIAVTGGAGFIGSHLTDRLLELGHQVLVIDNLSTGKRENLNPYASFAQLDVLQTDDITSLLESFLPDTVYHLAAQTSVSISMKDPLKDAAINVMGTINMLTACVHVGVRKFVFASSAAVYGMPVSLPISEEHALEPLSPYGLSKKTCELYIRLTCTQHNLSHSILRYANVYGPRQDSNGEAGVISIFTDRQLNGRGVSVFGNGHQTRDFIYVKDLVAANIAAMELDENVTLNIGTGIQTAISEVIRCLEHTSFPMTVEYAEKRLGDLEHSTLNNSKAVQQLKWSPRYTFLDGMSEYWRGLQKGRETV